MKKSSLMLAILPLVMAGSAFAQTADNKDQASQRPMPRMLAQADLDKDGSLTLEEMLKATEARFKEMDSNKDGKVSADEIREAGHRMMQKRMGGKKGNHKGLQMGGMNRPDGMKKPGMGPMGHRPDDMGPGMGGRPDGRPLKDCPCPCMEDDDAGDMH